MARSSSATAESVAESERSSVGVGARCEVAASVASAFAAAAPERREDLGLLPPLPLPLLFVLSPLALPTLGSLVFAPGGLRVLGRFFVCAHLPGIV